MKNLIVLWLSVCVCSAQNYGVILFSSISPIGTNVGVTIPTNYPVSIRQLGLDTNVNPPEVLMTLAQLRSVQTNANFRLFQIYTNIPTGMADSLTRSNLMFTLWQSNQVIAASMNSGTNSAAQNTARQQQLTQNTSTMSQQVYISYIYLNQILEYLSRLGPNMDPIGH